MPDSADTPVVVAIDVDRFDDTVRALRAMGVVVEQEMRDIGTVSGRMAGDRLADVQGLDGVIAVEPERPVQVPPPDSDIQ
jgi:hypothetical protein